MTAEHWGPVPLLLILGFAGTWAWAMSWMIHNPDQTRALMIKGWRGLRTTTTPLPRKGRVMDHLEQALMDALVARPWILAPTLPRNDKQTFELGYRAGWDARAARGDDIRIPAAMLTRLLDGDPVVRAAVRRVLAGGER